MAHSWQRMVGAGLFMSAAVVVVACGGDDNLSIPSGDDGGADVTGGGDDDGATPSDTGAPQDTGTGTDCTSAGTRAQCIACCVQQDPAGAAVLVKAEAQCACVPELCGPVEAGTPVDAGDDGGSVADASGSDGSVSDDGGADSGGNSGDAGGNAGDGGGASLLGTGACAATCSTATAPDPTCRKCLAQATGNKQNPGQCFTQVSTACQANTDCTTYTACTSTCK